MRGDVHIPNWGEFLDDHEEQHAVPAGAGLAFAAVASGELAALGIAATVLTEAVERGVTRPRAAKRQDLANDIAREPHYFAAGLAIGAVLGIAARMVTGSPLPAPLPLPW